MQHKPGTIFEAAAYVLFNEDVNITTQSQHEAYAGDHVNTGIFYDGNGVKVGKTYQMKVKTGSRFSTDYDVKVIKIDRNIVIYKKVAAPGTMGFQPERMPIEDFEDSLLTS